MIINKNALQSLFVGFSTAFAEGMRDAPSHWQDIATEVPSTSGENVYGWLGQSTSFREWLGDRIIKSLRAHAYTIANKPFENTVSVGRDDIADDRFGVYSPIFRQLGADAKAHPDELIFKLLQDGAKTSCYGGQYFFDTDHPVIDPKTGTENTVSNIIDGLVPGQDGGSSNWYLLDTSRAIRPLIFQLREPYKLVTMDDPDDEHVFMRREFLYGVDARANAGFGLWQLAVAGAGSISHSNYREARMRLMSFKSDSGRPFGTMPTLLVCGPSNESWAREVLLAEHNNDGSSNIWANSVRLIVTPWI